MSFLTISIQIHNMIVFVKELECLMTIVVTRLWLLEEEAVWMWQSV